METASFSSVDNCNGELSLLDFLERLRLDSSPEPVASPRNQTALVAIQLEDERKRRQECEKLVLHLQSQIATLQQDNTVAVTSVKRKDTLLLQAQQQFGKTVEDFKTQNKKLHDDNKLLIEKIHSMQVTMDKTLAEATTARTDLNLAREELKKNIETTASTLEQLQTVRNDLTAAKAQLDLLAARNKNLEDELRGSKLRQEEILRENHLLKNSLEEVSKQKDLLQTEYELAEDRHDNERMQWEEHCRLKINETIRLAEEDYEHRLKVWQEQVESKLKHLVTTLEHQLGVLKQKNIEEMQLVESRHKEELKLLELRCLRLQQKLQQQQREQHEAAAKMKQLLEAQWLTMSKMEAHAESRTTDKDHRKLTSPSAASDEGSRWSSSDANEAVATQKRTELQQYVNTILKGKDARRPTALNRPK